MPRRRCVGCGRIAPKSELLRIAAVRDDASRVARAVIDPRATIPGRGAYLCPVAGTAEPAADCLARARRRGGIARALRCSIADGSVTIGSKLVESMSP